MATRILYFMLFAPLFFACGNQGTERPTDEGDSLSAGDSAQIVVARDDNTVMEEDTAETVEESAAKTELKELKKVTFCECVKKQQAINKKIETAETDAEFDTALAEMDALENGDCKNLLAGNTDSPDKRAEHKRKVAECLSN